MKKTSVLTALAVVALGVAVQATPVTFTFQENGSNLALGSSSTFVESGASLTAYASSGQSLYAKSAGAGETGLGIVSDPTGDHEIYGSTFIQLLSTPSGVTLDSLFLSSVQAGETANIYFSTTLGSLGILIGSVTADGSFAILSAYQNGYLGVASGGGNVLLSTATGHTAPDGGSTMLLLGSALTGLGLLKRKFMA